MEMTDSEIVRSYREARDKRKQVKILSQLNLCEIEEILDILTKNGVKSQELPRTRRVNTKTETAETLPQASNQEQETADQRRRERIYRDALLVYQQQLEREANAAEEAYLAQKREFDRRQNEINQLLEELEGGGWKMQYRTAESVTIGHPDKLADLVADSILDECLKQDAHSRVACKVLIAHDTLHVAGEISTAAKINPVEIARRTI